MLEVIYKCAKCNKINVKNIEDNEYNLTKNIELVKSIYDDSLFLEECQECHAQSVIERDSLFIDDDYKFIIKLDTSNETKVLMINESKYLDYKIRIVKSLNDLKEKLRIFYSFLNDHVIETLKEEVFNEIDPSLNPDYLTFHKINEYGLSFVVISSMDEYLGSISIKFDKYYEIEKLINIDKSIQVVDFKLGKKYLKEIEEIYESRKNK